ncbi:histidine kinase [Actinoplanes sp. NPDC049802]|uniref:sensor histidine kinase n=1 Tax=Actinoplanes sp. NPDC049802 TaxID=3154742 RepID=UPI0033DC694B
MSSWWRRIPAPVLDAALILLAVLDIWVNLWSDAVAAQATAVIAVAALLLRHRFPLVAFLLTVPAEVTEDAAVAPFATLFALSCRTRDRRLLAACVVLSSLASASPSPFEGDLGFDSANLVYFAYGLAYDIVPVLLGQLVRARQDLAQRIDEIEEAKEHERVLHAQAVVARERAQLAREMHDVVSHQVSLIAVQAGALQVAGGDPQVREAARAIRTLSVGTLDELRTMVTLLRASGDDTTGLAPQPTLNDLRTLVSSSGIDVEITGTLSPSVGTPAQRAIYRTVQEALTNVRKHAAGAAATVELWQDPTHFGVTVTNTAPSRPALPLPGARQGLIGLQERAELLHGALESGPLPGGGYRVRMLIPLRPA